MPAVSDTRQNELARLWWTVAHTLSDSQQVIAMRLLGFTGLWSVPSSEPQQMLSEKGPACIEAAISGAMSALRGHAPERVMLATIDPISDKARANRARLASRGMRIFGG